VVCGELKVFAMGIGQDKMAAAMQMGPVLLPTPLSPARGLLFRRTFQEALGARCLILQRVGGFRHRRSRRHPVSLSRRSCSSWPKPFQAVPTFRRSRDHSPFGGYFSQAAGFRLGVIPPSIGNQVPGLSGGSAIAFSSDNCTCFQLAPSACPVSKTAWTITTASVVLRNSREINSLELNFRLDFSPFRCFETAPSQ